MSVAKPRPPERAEVVLDAERRPTIPEWVSDELGLQAGDRLTVSVDEAGSVILRSRREAARRALATIRRNLAGIPILTPAADVATLRP